MADGTLDLDAFTPRLVHADLASYHLLIDPNGWVLSGVLDFGTAGLGDPAVDIALLLNTYGESVVRRLDDAYPIGAELLDRARFLAAALKLEWPSPAWRATTHLCISCTSGAPATCSPLARGGSENYQAPTRC